MTEPRGSSFHRAWPVARHVTVASEADCVVVLWCRADGRRMVIPLKPGAARMLAEDLVAVADEVERE